MLLDLFGLNIHHLGVQTESTQVTLTKVSEKQVHGVLKVRILLVNT